MRSQSKILLQTLKGLIGKYRESQLTGSATSVATSTGEGKPKLYLTNCWGLSVDNSES